MPPSAPPSPSSSTSSFLPTTTLLAIPDGPLPSSSKDARSHTTSFIGGYASIPPPPSASTSKIPEKIACGNCHNPLPLLTQVYCPPDGGENDRTVYVFGCGRGACQRREGSIRAFRASIFNSTYAADAAEQREKREKEERERRERERVNPFSADATNLVGGLGATLFGAGGDGEAASNPFNPFSAAPATPTKPEDSTTTTSSITNPFSSLSFSAPTPSQPATSASPAAAAAGPSTPSLTYSPPLPAYLPAQYLTTFDEYLPRDPEALSSDTAKRVKQLEAGEGEVEAEMKASGGGGGGGMEQWERVLPKGVDEVFERFVNRLNRAEDGEGQVLRYDLGAVPLPYSSKSDLYKKLFASKSGAPGTLSAVTKSIFNVNTPGGDDDDDDDIEDNSLSKMYNPSSIPPCSRCGGRRVFEMQLTPALIAELKTDSLSLSGPKEKSKSKNKKKKQTEEERRKELAILLGRASADIKKKDVTSTISEDGGEEKSDLERQEEELRNESGMEWGTVMIFGCEGDCVGFGEEWVGVEWEEVE